MFLSVVMFSRFIQIICKYSPFLYVLIVFHHYGHATAELRYSIILEMVPLTNIVLQLWSAVTDFILLVGYVCIRVMCVMESKSICRHTVRF